MRARCECASESFKVSRVQYVALRTSTLTVVVLFDVQLMHYMRAYNHYVHSMCIWFVNVTGAIDLLSCICSLTSAVVTDYTSGQVRV